MHMTYNMHGPGMFGHYQYTLPCLAMVQRLSTSQWAVSKGPVCNGECWLGCVDVSLEP